MACGDDNDLYKFNLKKLKFAEIGETARLSEASKLFVHRPVLEGRRKDSLSNYSGSPIMLSSQLDRISKKEQNAVLLEKTQAEISYRKKHVETRKSHFCRSNQDSKLQTGKGEVTQTHPDWDS